MFVQQALYLLSYALSPYIVIFKAKNNLGKCTNIPKYWYVLNLIIGVWDYDKHISMSTYVNS